MCVCVTLWTFSFFFFVPFCEMIAKSHPRHPVATEWSFRCNSSHCHRNAALAFVCWQTSTRFRLRRKFDFGLVQPILSVGGRQSQVHVSGVSNVCVCGELTKRHVGHSRNVSTLDRLSNFKIDSILWAESASVEQKGRRPGNSKSRWHHPWNCSEIKQNG